jgi:hypothetical protein
VIADVSRERRMGWHPSCYLHDVGGRQEPGDQ